VVKQKINFIKLARFKAEISRSLLSWEIEFNTISLATWQTGSFGLIPISQKTLAALTISLWFTTKRKVKQTIPCSQFSCI